MATDRSHDDGKSFVPNEPMNIPRNAPLADRADIAEPLPDVPGWPKDGAAEIDRDLYRPLRSPKDDGSRG